MTKASEITTKTWAPTVATAISYYRQGTHEIRINYLAMQCKPLVVTSK